MVINMSRMNERLWGFSLFFILVLLPHGVFPNVNSNVSQADGASQNDESFQPSITQALDNAARSFFVENVGQINSSSVLFYGYIDTFYVSLGNDGIQLYELSTGRTLKLEFVNSQGLVLHALDAMDVKYNFFLGSRGEYIDVMCYSHISYKNVWPHINLNIRLIENRVEYEYIVRPGGNVSDIQIKIIEQASIPFEKNEIEIGLKERQIVEGYTIGNQKNQQIQIDFVQEDIDIYSLQVYDYDCSSTLIIDCLIYSTYIGGSEIDIGRDIAVDKEGNIYITGRTSSTNFPIQNAYDSTYNAGTASITYDCFISKIDSSGAIVYSTYVGGLFWEEGNGIAVDDEGIAYVTGGTRSIDFPTVNGYDESFGGGSYDCFILILNATGNGLVYSTYLGGAFSDMGQDIIIDGVSNIFISGRTASSSFPTVNAYDDTWNDGYDCFVSKMNSTGTGLIYSTYVGGTFSYTPPYDDRDDVAVALAVDTFGNAYVSGYTNSLYFPTVNAYDDTLGSWNTEDCFVFKLNATGNGLIYSTYIGGTGQDQATDITIDAEGCAYITGLTQSTDFPLVGALDSTLNGTSDSFLVKLSPEGDQLLYSTLLGGNDTDSGQSLMCDALNNIYLGGTTTSPDFPVVNGVEYDGNGSADCFVLKLNITANSIMYSTCMGGTMDDSLLSLVIDSYGTVYATGSTYSDDFPMVDPYDDTQNGESDVFVFLLPDFGDSDSDGIPDYNESLYGTDRFLADSDFDGLGDFDEIFTYLTNPLSNDSDSDALDDFSEVMVYLTNPLNNDSDSDFMSDGWEVLYTLDPLDPTDAGLDLDNDTLLNLGEYQHGTLPDNWDTDSDLMSDGWEVQYGLNPLDPTDATGDLDADFLTNLQEYELGTNPRSSDSDLDGIPDNWEVSMGFDPLDPTVPLIEYLLYNLHITILVSVFIVGVCVGLIYRLRPRLERRKMRKEQEEEHKEIEEGIRDLGGHDTRDTQNGIDDRENGGDTKKP